MSPDGEESGIGAVTELVYSDEAVDFIRSRWPQTVVTDATDIVHDEQSHVEIPGITDDEFYPVVMRAGWAGSCLGFGIMVRTPEGQPKIRRWLDEIKASAGL